MAKGALTTRKGKIDEIGPDGRSPKNDHRINACIGGGMRKFRIRLAAGDRVHAGFRSAPQRQALAPTLTSITRPLPPKDIMQLQKSGSHRSKLSLPFGRVPSSTPAFERCSPTLSGQELRRIVSEMLG